MQRRLYLRGKAGIRGKRERKGGERSKGKQERCQRGIKGRCKSRA